MKQILTLFCVLFTVIHAYGRSIFVSTQGNDQNPGTIFYPLKTVQKAVDYAQPGDIVVVEEGVYKEVISVINKAGTKDAPITIMARGNVILIPADNIKRIEPTAVIHGKEENIADGLNPYYPFYLGSVIRLEYCQYITVEGFTIQGSPWMGISALECDNLTLNNNSTDNTGASGIYILWSRNVNVFNNEITRACGYPTRVSAGGSQGHGTQECLSIVSCDGFEVAFNKVHENNIYSLTEAGGTGSGGEGIDVKEHSANGTVHHNLVYNLKRLGLYCDAWNAHNVNNIEFYNNIVHDCQGGIGVGAEDGGSLHDIKIYNNLVFNITWSGLQLASWGHNGVKKNIWIYNNLFHNCESGAIYLGDELQDSIYVYNNIAYENGRGSSRRGSMENADINMGKAKNVFMESNIFGKNPGIVDVSRYNYRLAPGSKAIDAGIAIEDFGYNFDLDDNPRTKGASIDIGPFEFDK